MFKQPKLREVNWLPDHPASETFHWGTLLGRGTVRASGGRSQSERILRTAPPHNVYNIGVWKRDPHHCRLQWWIKVFCVWLLIIAYASVQERQGGDQGSQILLSILAGAVFCSKGYSGCVTKPSRRTGLRVCQEFLHLRCHLLFTFYFGLLSVVHSQVDKVLAPPFSTSPASPAS